MVVVVRTCSDVPAERLYDGRVIEPCGTHGQAPEIVARGAEEVKKRNALIGFGGAEYATQEQRRLVEKL